MTFLWLIKFYLVSVQFISDLRGPYDKFPDFFHMGTFIDSTHMKL